MPGRGSGVVEEGAGTVGWGCGVRVGNAKGADTTGTPGRWANSRFGPGSNLGSPCVGGRWFHGTRLHGVRRGGSISRGMESSHD